MNRVAAACAAAALMSVALPAVTAHAAATPRIDLRVLVVDDGGSLGRGDRRASSATRASRTPTVDLSSAGRPVINAAFLTDTVDGRPRAKFQGVVLPNENPFGAGSAEMAALAAYEKTFGDPPGRRLHLPAPGRRPEVHRQRRLLRQPRRHRRPTVTAAGTRRPLRLPRGPVPFEDNSPLRRRELRLPRKPAAPATPATSHVDADPGQPRRGGSLVGEYTHDGRSELVLTFGYNQYQQQFRLLAHGIVEWLTKGVHLGYSRNYFAVHVDDIFAADDRWSNELNCTPGETTARPGERPRRAPIRMTPADVELRRRSGRSSKNFTLDMLFNARAAAAWTSPENGGSTRSTDPAGRGQGRVPLDQPHLHAPVPRLRPGHHRRALDAARPTPSGAVQYMSRAEISDADHATTTTWGATAKGLAAQTDRAGHRRALRPQDPAAAARGQPQPGRARSTDNGVELGWAATTPATRPAQGRPGPDRARATR